MSEVEAVKKNMRDIIRNRVLERKRQKENANKANANKNKNKLKTKKTLTKATTKATKRMTKYRGDIDKLELVRNEHITRNPAEGYEYFRRDGKYYDTITMEPVAWTNPNGEIILHPKKKSTLKRRKELNQLTKAASTKAATIATKAKAVRPKPVYRGDMDNLELVRNEHITRNPAEGYEYFRKDGKYYDVVTMKLVARTKPDGKIVH